MRRDEVWQWCLYHDWRFPSHKIASRQVLHARIDDARLHVRALLHQHAHGLPTPRTLHPAPYTLHPTPYTLHPAPYTLHPAPYTLHPTP
ncbi:hypothetical protein T484DRAFT_1617109, partial [Baffinella frigidus]